MTARKINIDNSVKCVRSQSEHIKSNNTNIDDLFQTNITSQTKQKTVKKLVFNKEFIS